MERGKRVHRWGTRDNEADRHSNSALSLLVAGCEKETPTSTGNEATPEHAPLSPWHGLTEEEINEAAAAVVQASSESPLFNRISLAEPKKSEALRWSPGTDALRAADVRFRLGRKSYSAHYEFSTGSLSEPLELTSGQPMLVGAEIYGALEAVNALPEVQEALRRRGVDAEDGLCLLAQPGASLPSGGPNQAAPRKI